MTTGSIKDIENDDTFWFIICGFFAFPALAVGAGQLWAQGSDWLVEPHILVPESASPMVSIPAMGGAGLDLARLSIAAGLVVLLGALTALSVQSIARRRDSIQ